MYHTKTAQETISKLNSNINTGLSSKQAEALIQKDGLNQIAQQKKDSNFKKFINQFTNALIVILILAAIISALLHEYIDAVVIFVIVIINGLLGYIQEAKAEKSVEALKSLSVDHTMVLRDGEVNVIDVSQIVVGDIVVLESGDKVPADGRLIECVSLEVNESILTGEATPVRKNEQEIIRSEAAIGDRINMVFKDTTVISGRTTFIVTATGVNTEIGKISTLLGKEQPQKTPLTIELDGVAKRLTIAALVIIGVVATLGIVRGFLAGNETLEALQLAILTAISLAVAAIPEGLPAVVTISLALGVSQLAKHKAIIRKLEAVETLGSTNVILTDKTGTLTQNKMTVTDIFVGQNIQTNYTVVSHQDHNVILDKEHRLTDYKQNKNLQWLINCGVLCNDARFTNTKNEFLGDSTETALLELAYLSKINITDLNNTYERLFEIPFSSSTKKMVVVTKNPDDEQTVIVISKGAPEVIQWMVNEENSQIQDVNDKFVKDGLRTLAFSYKTLSKNLFEQAKTTENPEEILSKYHIFAGIIAQKDPIRPEVKHALAVAKIAGIETFMLTGDHKLTAIAIAKDLELINSENQAIDGIELGNPTQQELIKILESKRVFARVSPEQKLNIVKAMKFQNLTTAVTGDGVNDAPAIKTADIGISMGITGTDVSKEVSDMILQDDNYATIIEAIKQGRIVYDNLVKFITYLISCNISEILVITIAMILGTVLPLVPVQILWLNLLTDGLPALALGIEPGEKDIMNRPARKKGTLLTNKRWLKMVFIATIITISTFTMYMIGLHYSDMVAQTMALTTIAISQLFNALNYRSETHSILSTKIPSNPKLYLVLLGTFLIQILVVYTNIGNTLLKTTPIPVTLFVACVLSAFMVLVAGEIYKVIENAFSNNNRVLKR